MTKHVSFNELNMAKGDSISIEKTDSMTIAATEVVNITSSSIEFTAPRYETGGIINFKPGEAVNIHYWTANGNKYIFQSIIQNARTLNNTHSIIIPDKAKHDGVRRWQRYKPINMIVTFLNKTNTNKLNDSIYIGRVVNISAGGILISTPKRFNIDDCIGLGFYIKNKFFTAIGTVKGCEASMINLGEMEVALQFTNYTEKDKEYLESILSTL